MYHDLSLSFPASASFPSASSSRSAQGAAGSAAKGKSKGKGKEKEPAATGTSAAAAQHDALAALSPEQHRRLHALTADMAELGFSTVAFNHVVATRYSGQVNPFATAAAALGERSRPVFPELAPRSDGSAKGKERAAGIVQLQRVTITLDDETMKGKGIGLISSATLPLLTWDLLSVMPTTEATFSLACLTLTELKPMSIDIIALDLSASSRLPFHLKRSTVSNALENGAVFEIAYTAMLDDDDGRRRRNIVSAGRDLIRITGGKGIILSSAASELLGVRGPNDVMNLASLFGLSPQAARDCITSTARSLLIRAETRKTYRGILSKPMAGTSSIPGVDVPLASGTQEAGTLPDPSSDMVMSDVGSRKRKEAEDVDARPRKLSKAERRARKVSAG